MIFFKEAFKESINKEVSTTLKPQNGTELLTGVTDWYEALSFEDTGSKHVCAKILLSIWRQQGQPGMSISQIYCTWFCLKVKYATFAGYVPV